MRKDWGDLLAQHVDLRIHDFFSTTAAMLAMPVDEYEDGQFIVCEDSPTPFVFKLYSRAKPNGSSIQAPAPTGVSFNPETTAGRFFRQVNVDAFVFVNPPAASAVALRAATATVMAISVAALLSGGLTSLGTAARQIVLTVAGTTPAHAPATALISGLDAMGNIISETVNLNLSGGAVTSVNYYVNTNLTVTFPPAGGTDATVAIGWGAKLGLPRPIAVVQSLPIVLSEYAAGAKVTNGVFTGPSTDAPNGAYAPNHAPDGATTYVVIADIAA